jgi:hypothetical protein
LGSRQRRLFASQMIDMLLGSNHLNELVALVFEVQAIESYPVDFHELIGMVLDDGAVSLDPEGCFLVLADKDGDEPVFDVLPLDTVLVEALIQPESIRDRGQDLMRQEGECERDGSLGFVSNAALER